MFVGKSVKTSGPISFQEVIAPKDQPRKIQNFQIKDLQKKTIKEAWKESFGKKNLWDESWASSYGLNKFPESQNTPKLTYNPSKTADKKSAKNDHENHRKRKTRRGKRMNSRFQPTTWLNNHEIFFTRTGLASSLHPPSRNWKTRARGAHHPPYF
jgi:hypothetical protein